MRLSSSRGGKVILQSPAFAIVGYIKKSIIYVTFKEPIFAAGPRNSLSEHLLLAASLKYGTVITNHFSKDNLAI